MDLSSIFGMATSAVGAVASVGGVVAAAGLYFIAGPRQLKPDNASAKVITARRFPNIATVQKFAVKDSSALYLKWGASNIDEVPLKIFPVEVERVGKHALLVNDKMKVEVQATFHVSVNGDGATAENIEGGEKATPMTGEQSIIKAIESLGEVTEKTVAAIVEARFDNALRVAAAGMTIENIHANRGAFLKAVKEALILSDCGLKLNDLAIRTLTPASIDAYDPTNAFDAEGLKIVTQITQDSKKIRNDTEQNTKTQIAARDKDEEIRRLTIQEEQRKATLEQGERVAQMEAEQARRVAEVTASSDKLSRLARVNADQEVEIREIEKQQVLDVAAQAREQAVTTATIGKDKAVQTATIERQTVIETAERDKQIVLHAKAAEEAQAQETANHARAKAVAAEEEVTTVRQLAEAERKKKLEITHAEAEAGKEASTRRIESETLKIVATNEADAARTRAEGEATATETAAKGRAAAVILEADADYQRVFKAAKAGADGRLADAEAVAALNKAHNAMDAGVRQYQLDRARIDVSPMVVAAMTESFGKIGDVKILSMPGGMPNFGTAGGAVASGAGNNVFEQFYNSTMGFALKKGLMGHVLETIGGDKKIADHLPDIGGAMAAAATSLPTETALPAAPAVVVPVAASEQDNGPVVRDQLQSPSP